MEEENKNQIGNAINNGKEKMKDAKRKADKAKRAFKIFMKLPTPVKIAIIAVPLVIILVVVLLAGAAYLLDLLEHSNTTEAKNTTFGITASGEAGTSNTGYSYSDKVVQMNGSGNWEISFADQEYTDKLTENGLNPDEMTEDEKMIQLFIANGLDSETYTEEELNLLPYLMKAELASLQPDLRSADEMYDGNTYKAPNLESLGENQIQGAVHFKRISSKDMSTTVLSYIDYATFQSYNNNIAEGKKYFSFNDDNNLVVYTWNHTKYTYTYTDGKGTTPNEIKKPNTDEYFLTETVIDYKPLVYRYALPFDVLTALLITSEDVNFTKQVADLAFTSNIEIALIEEYTEATTVNTTEFRDTIRDYKYINGTVKVNGTTVINETNKLIHNQTDGASIVVNCEHTAPAPTHSFNYTEQEQKFDSTTPTYTEAETIYTETNTYKYGITKADMWFANIEKEFSAREETPAPTTNTGDYQGDFQKHTDAQVTSTGDAALNEIKNLSRSIYNDYTSRIENAKNSVSAPAVYYNGTNLVVSSGSRISTIKVKVPSQATADGYTNNTYNAYNTSYTIPNATQVTEVIVQNQNGTFTFKKNEENNTFRLESSNIGVVNNLSVTRYQYKKQDTKTTSNTTRKSWLVEEGENRTQWYDQRGQKFLKAIEDNSKAEALLYNVPGWLFEMLDSVDTNYTTIISYLMDMYLYGESEITTDKLEQILDLYGTDSFRGIGGTYGSGAGWYWPIDLNSSGVPYSTTISSRWGPRTLADGTQGFHEAIDISCDRNTPIVATKAGTVIKVVNGFGEGRLSDAYLNKANYVKIKHDDGMESWYWHLSTTIYVSEGDAVEQGQVIALSGNSGKTSGPHLHFSIRDSSGNSVNPEDYVDPNNPRPTLAAGGLSEELYSMLLYFEGGTQHMTESGDYKIFNNGIDRNYELTCGIAVGYMGSGSYYPTLVPNPQVGQIVTKDIYNQIFEIVCNEKNQYIDKACAKHGVTLTQNQRDAVFLFVYNMSNGERTADGAIKAYKNGGAESYYQYTKDCSISAVQARRDKEYALFTNGTYIK